MKKLVAGICLSDGSQVLFHIQLNNETSEDALGFFGVSTSGRAEMGTDQEPDWLEKMLAYHTCPEAICPSRVLLGLSPGPGLHPCGLSVRALKNRGVCLQCSTFVGIPGPPPFSGPTRTLRSLEVYLPVRTQLPPSNTEGLLCRRHGTKKRNLREANVSSFTLELFIY